MSDLIGPGDATTDTATAAILVSVETPGTHVGVANLPFTVAYGGSIISYDFGQPFIADAGLYAAINSAGVSVTWSS